MKINLALFALIICFFNGNAQEETIELPSVDVNLGMVSDPHFDIYVTNDNKIIYRKDTIGVKDLKEMLYQPLPSFPIASAYMKKQIHLFADKKVNYSFIDAIKTEISSTNSSKYLIYRSNFEQKKRSNIKGVKHKSPLSYYTFSPPEYLRTKKEVRERDSIIKRERELYPDLVINQLPIPSTNETEWKAVYSVERAVYSIQENVIDEVLANKSYRCYKITNEGLIDVSNKKSLFNKEDLTKILKNVDLVFLKHDTNLSYGNYLRFVKVLQELKPNFKPNKGYAEVIELSSQIQQLHKKVNIKLCD